VPSATANKFCATALPRHLRKRTNGQGLPLSTCKTGALPLSYGRSLSIDIHLSRLVCHGLMSLGDANFAQGAKSALFLSEEVTDPGVCKFASRGCETLAACTETSKAGLAAGSLPPKLGGSLMP
jgi:hypothetical protein